MAVINVVGLIGSLIGPDMPNIALFHGQGTQTRIRPAFPAVTCTAQSNYFTGTPPSRHGIGFGHPVIIDARVAIVTCVHRPGFAHLAGVVHTLDSLGLHFGFRQSRQQHRRQDGDDGYNDEQFNQGESFGGSCIGTYHSYRTISAGTGF
jgi:hypothetical protein